MVLEDRRAAAGHVPAPDSGRRRLLRSRPTCPGLAPVTAAMMREGTTTRTTLQIAEQLETHGRRRSTVATRPVVDRRDGLRLEPDRELRRRRSRWPPTSCSTRRSRRRSSTRYKDAHARGPGPAADQPGFPRERDVLAASCTAAIPASRVSITDAGARQADARRRWSASTARATCPTTRCSPSPATSRWPRRARSSRRSSAAWKKARHAGAGRRRSAGDRRRRKCHVHRPAQLGADQPHRRHAGIKRTSPDYDIVQVMNQVIGGGPTGRLFTHPARREGLHLRRLQQRLGRPGSAATGSASTDVRTEVTEAGAARPDGRDRAHARRAGARRRNSRTRSAAWSRRSRCRSRSPAAVLNNHVTRWLYKLPADYWDKLSRARRWP